jgi:hypothetical protein
MSPHPERISGLEAIPESAAAAGDASFLSMIKEKRSLDMSITPGNKRFLHAGRNDWVGWVWRMKTAAGTSRHGGLQLQGGMAAGTKRFLHSGRNDVSPPAIVRDCASG